MTTFEKYRKLQSLPMTPSKRGLVTIPQDIGEKCELRWISFSQLVVDDRYQRSIARNGRSNVWKILLNFNWSKFAPVVVTRLIDVPDEDLYAIIDGQTRATAALMHPAIDAIPCMVISVSPEDAASVFSAINGQVTRITAGQLWKARLASGDKVAAAIQCVIDASEVRVMPYRKRPKSAGFQPGDERPQILLMPIVSYETQT